MGFLEAIAEHLSVKFIASFLLFALILRGIVNRIDENRRLKRLGNQGIDVATWIPFGEMLPIMDPSQLDHSSLF